MDDWVTVVGKERLRAFHISDSIARAHLKGSLGIGLVV